MLPVEDDCPAGISPGAHQQAGGFRQPFRIIYQLAGDTQSLPLGQYVEMADEGYFLERLKPDYPGEFTLYLVGYRFQAEHSGSDERAGVQ